MAGTHRYHSTRKKRSGGFGWAMLLFCIAFALLLRYGQSEPLIRLRQKGEAWLAESEVYEQAVSRVGKLFTGDGEHNIVSVFGQLFFGQEQPIQ